MENRRHIVSEDKNEQKESEMFKGVSIITKLRNVEDELRETKEELMKLKEKHKSEIREIIGNTDTANLFIALKSEVLAAKKKANGLEIENNTLRLRIARMEQADAKKDFDYDSWNTVAMKGGNVSNIELNNLTQTITELRTTVSRLTKDVADRDLKLQESWFSRAESNALEGYQSMTVDELQETLKLKERLVAELRTMKSEYHQQIMDMRERIDILENDGSGRGRVRDKGMGENESSLVSLRAKNDALEKMLDGFMRTLKNIRHGDGMDMTVGGAYQRTKASIELCANLGMDTPQLKQMSSQLNELARDIEIFITNLREKIVTCKKATDYTNKLLYTSGELISLLEDKVQNIDDAPLVKDLRSQLLNIPRPLRMVLGTLRYLKAENMVEYELSLDNEEVHHLKAEMKIMQVKLAKVEIENAGLMSEISLLESGSKMSTDSVGYRLALLRQQYKDRIVELELSIEEVLKQAEDELSQAHLEIRQLQTAQDSDRIDRTAELDTICALTEKLGAELRSKDDELNSTKTEYERRILVLMKNYEERIAELEISNEDFKWELRTLNDELDFLRGKSDDDFTNSTEKKPDNSSSKDNEELREKVRKFQNESIQHKHKYNTVLEESQNKIRRLQDELKTTHERCDNLNVLIKELRKRLKGQEQEMATESRIMMKMSEQIIDRLQKRLAEQERKLEQLGTSADLLSDGERRQLDGELAALHKDLRIKEVEIEEITDGSKHATERYEKEINRLIKERGTYSELCSNLRMELAAERNSKVKIQSPKEKSRRQTAESKRYRDLVQKLTIKANSAEETIKNFRKRIVTLTMEQETETNALVLRLKNQRGNHEKTTKQIRDKYETQIGELIRNYEDRITKIRSSCEDKVRISREGRKSRVDQRLSMLRAQHTAYVKTLRTDHSSRISEFLKDFKNHLEERDKIIRQYDRSILSTLPNFEDFAANCDDMESARHRSLDALQKQILALEDELAKEDAKSAANERRTRELESLVVKLKRLFEASEERLTKSVVMLEEQNDVLKKEYEEDLVALHEQRQASEKDRAAKLRIRWPKRRNVTLILSLRHDHYLAV